MGMKIWMIDGHGGLITSLGWRAYGRKLVGLGFDVSYGWWSRGVGDIARDINSHKVDKVAILGYSLGGNCATWVANMLQRDISLIVAYDPTVNAPLYPLGPNVKRALSYHQCSRFLTSALFGGAVMESKPDGPKVEVTNVWSDHLLLQFNSKLHNKTTEALEKLWASS